MIININYSEMNEGYMYDVYQSENDLSEGNDSLAGGLCTGTEQNALEMAMDCAKELLQIARVKADMQGHEISSLLQD